MPEKNTEGPRHPEAGPSEENSTQPIDFIEGPAKVQRTQKIDAAGPSQDSPRSRGAGPSSEPLNGAGLKSVETPKVQRPTVLETFDELGTFDKNDETQQSDLWEVEI